MSNSSSPTCDHIKSLFNNIENVGQTDSQNILQRLQAIRLWQLKQQEELKTQQETQLALLKSQSVEKSCQEIENDVLAVPLSSYSDHLDTILEQSSFAENKKQADNENCSEKFDENSAHNLDDSIPLQLEKNIKSIKSNSPAKDICLSMSENEALEHKTEPNNCNSEKCDELHSDIESSFESVSSEQKVLFDDLTDKSGKASNEILTEQLAQEKISKLNTGKQVGASTPKQPFLRKGQGLARYKGPPKKSNTKPKLETVSPENIKVHIINKEPTSNSNDCIIVCNKDDSITSTKNDCAMDKNNVIESSNGTIKTKVNHKPCVRKTARLSNREPLKHLTLKSDLKLSPMIDENKCSDQEPGFTLKSHNESVWSDVEDSVLALDTTQVNDYNTTSNETFEQMEKFCNEHYADVSSVKTLEEDDSVIMKKIEPLPPNKLMLQLFPVLRADVKRQSEKPNSLSKNSPLCQSDEDSNKPTASEDITSVNSVSAKPSNHSFVLKSKLEEIQSEIKHFQQESAKLSLVRKEEESQLQLLKQEFEEFQKQKEEELNRLNDFKKSEIKKLKKEKKIFEDYSAATKSMPNKRDREYIQELENKILDLQNESKQKEQRLHAVNSRLRSQLEVVTEENEHFKAKLEQLEVKVSKLEHEKGLRKNKQSQVAWKAINDIVDAIPLNNENANIDDYIQSNLRPKDISSKPVAEPLPLRRPLIDMNDNNKLNKSEVLIHGGKTEHHKKDGSVEIAFQNGTKKLVHSDGTTEIKFTNGDIKSVFMDGTVKYHYMSSGTWHTTHPNGMQVIEFSNKQVERHFPDGSKHITFEDGSSKMIKLNGSEETIFPDGTVMTVDPSGEKTIEFSNGQREIHTTEFKRREYPDGTCKTVFSDGRQETRYSSGRLRIKDSNGTLLVDKVVNT